MANNDAQKQAQEIARACHDRAWRRASEAVIGEDVTTVLNRISVYDVFMQKEVIMAVALIIEPQQWHPLSEKPTSPMAVELFRANYPFYSYTPISRDERREIGFFDGTTFRHNGAAHEVDESWTDHAFIPTHWRMLPDTPRK